MRKKGMFACVRLRKRKQKIELCAKQFVKSFPTSHGHVWG